MKNIKLESEEELIKELKCNELCFIKNKVRNKEKVEDKIHDCGCLC